MIRLVVCDGDWMGIGVGVGSHWDSLPFPIIIHFDCSIINCGCLLADPITQLVLNISHIGTY